jgi:gas vesicle protein
MSFDKSTVKVAAIVAGGVALGAGLGLLYAPQSGAETRRQIRHYSKRARFQAVRFGRDVKDGMNRAIENGKSLWADRPKRAA